MKQLYHSAKLFAYGTFCDACANFCTNLAERCLIKNKPLNKKLLIFMSNFSADKLLRWQIFERQFIDRFIDDDSFRLP